MNNIVVCWAVKEDMDFLEKSFSINWEFDYVNNLNEMGNSLKDSDSKIVLIKLEKSNVLNIIREKKKLQTLQDHFQVPITFLVKYDNPLIESSYQLLIVDDTEIINVNNKNIERVIGDLVQDKFRINRYVYGDKSYRLDGRSYQFA